MDKEENTPLLGEIALNVDDEEFLEEEEKTNLNFVGLRIEGDTPVDSRGDTLTTGQIIAKEPPCTCSIVATGVPSQMNHRQIADFFSFCGNITALSVMPVDGDDTSVTVVVTFESPAAAKTSILLDKSILCQKQINVQLASTKYPLNQPQPTRQPEPDFQLEYINHHNLPAEQRSQTSVIAGLLVKGYQLSADAFQKARQFDESHAITQQLNREWSHLAAGINALDKQYHISENGEKLKEQISTKYRQLDQHYDITGNIQVLNGQVSTLLTGASQSMAVGVEIVAGAIGRFVQMNPSIQQQLSYLREIGDAAHTQLSGNLTNKH